MDRFSLDAYDFHLPEGQIAQEPAPKREESRLLVLDRASGRIRDRRFHDLPELLRAGDLLVVNDTRVFPARLKGSRTPGGGVAELLLVDERPDGTWEALARPGRRLKPGASMDFGGGRLRAEIEDVLADGRRVVRFSSEEPFWEVIEDLGEPPLPPYIRRSASPAREDAERYQTVYARERGAVAAPTAGLHFTEALLNELRSADVRTASVTLHVGYGTFEPVRVTDLKTHRVAAERFSVPAEAVEAIRQTKARGGRVIAVGTTSARALESATDKNGDIRSGPGLAELTIIPDYSFRTVGAMITNFHLPKSSLLVMVSTFGGRENVLGAYRHAVTSGYRFYSYGDAMMIL